jgi:hypothetical protein
VGETISYLDAWSLWFSGQEVDPQLRMGPMTVLWWGRTGKLAAFIGGATVILDLMGPKRLRRIGRRSAEELRVWNQSLRKDHERNPWSRRAMGFTTASCIFLIGLFAVSIFTLEGNVLPAVPYLAIGVIGLVAIYSIDSRLKVWILDRTEPGLILRYLASALLLIGFHFDLLAS